jgi:hypothetical protein
MKYDFIFTATGGRRTVRFTSSGQDIVITTGLQFAYMNCGDANELRQQKFYLDVPTVTKLCLESNGITTLSDDIGQLVIMQEFRASYNCLTTLPSVMEKLTALRTLALRGNRFTQFPREILDLKNLTLLDMSCNLLTAIPRELCTLEELEDMNLCNNFLSWVPVELGSWHDGQFIQLGGNKWPPEELSGVSSLTDVFRITKHIGMIRYAAGTVCIAMQNLNLPALLTLLIIDELFENDIRMWAKWELITAVKHFHDRHD